MNIIEEYANRIMLGMYEMTRPEEAFGKHYKYKLPLWCAENGFTCLFQPSTLSYVIISNSDNEWKIV